MRAQEWGGLKIILGATDRSRAVRFRAEQHFEALLQLLHARCERDLLHVGIHIECGERQVVPPSALVPNPLSFTMVSDEAGRFTIRGVPTALEAVRVRATVTRSGLSTSTTSPPIAPVSIGGVKVGDIVVVISR